MLLPPIWGGASITFLIWWTAAIWRRRDCFGFLTWHTIRLDRGVICVSGALNCWRGLVGTLTIADACKSIRSLPKFSRRGPNISKLAKNLGNDLIDLQASAIVSVPT